MGHIAKPAFAHSSGPQNARIAFVAEAWGETEERQGVPLVGSSGQEFTRMLRDAGIERSECFLTSTLALRPPANMIEALCSSKADVGRTYPFASISQGKYLRAEYLPEAQRLGEELRSVNPNIVVALGNTACWALLGSGRISSIRGTVTSSTNAAPAGVEGLKILPTYHPVSVLRQWSQRPIVIADLLKAKRESEFPEIRRPERQVLVNVKLGDLDLWRVKLAQAPLISTDIETSGGQITHVGFAISRSEAICVKFLDRTQPNWSYWPDESQERCAWEFVRWVLELENPKLFQNGLYDLAYFIRAGFRVRNSQHDTMLHHHAMYVEMQKGLGFLGSIYTGEAAWKLLRGKHVSEEKRDDE